MDRPLPELLASLAERAQQVIDHVRAEQARADRRLVEETVLQGLEESTAGRDQLSRMVESGRVPRQEAEAVTEALAQVEQKLAFFQGCTMRRSSRPPGGQDEHANAHAEESERLAAQAQDEPGLDQLIEAYKRTEWLEARILELREVARSGTGPEPRVLDLPRTRVLVARRTIGGIIAQLDD
jgi:hypothetical protein